MMQTEERLVIYVHKAKHSKRKAEEVYENIISAKVEALNG